MHDIIIYASVYKITFIFFTGVWIMILSKIDFSGNESNLYLLQLFIRQAIFKVLKAL